MFALDQQTAIAPALCVATLESLALIKQGNQNAKLLDNIQYFQRLAGTGWH
jgi:8-amino-7-oxononanoate synthase